MSSTDDLWAAVDNQRKKNRRERRAEAWASRAYRRNLHGRGRYGRGRWRRLLTVNTGRYAKPFAEKDQG